MDTNEIFLDCPAYLDDHGRIRCGLPAEVEYRYVAVSLHGPIESTKIRCPVGHWFNGTVEDLAIGRAPASCREGAYPASPPRS